MDTRLTLVEKAIPQVRFLILKKVNETSGVPARSSAAYAASVGENYVLAEPRRREPVPPSTK